MNRFISITPLRLIALTVSGIALALSLFVLTGAPAETQPAIAGTAPSYYAALVGQHVAIYLTGRAEPVLITEIDVRTLPDADREMLEKGLPLATADDVSRLLEDYDN